MDKMLEKLATMYYCQNVKLSHYSIRAVKPPKLVHFLVNKKGVNYLAQL